jgi:hypothetical protein
MSSGGAVPRIPEDAKGFGEKREGVRVRKTASRLRVFNIMEL